MNPLMKAGSFNDGIICYQRSCFLIVIILNYDIETRTSCKILFLQNILE